jgi:hypothetical protein
MPPATPMYSYTFSFTHKPPTLSPSSTLVSNTPTQSHKSPDLTSAHELGIYRTSISNLLICDSDPLKTPLYYIDTSTAKGRADLTLYSLPASARALLSAAPELRGFDQGYSPEVNTGHRFRRSHTDSYVGHEQRIERHEKGAPFPKAKALKQLAITHGTVQGTAYIRNASKDPERRMRIVLGHPDLVRGSREVEMRKVKKWSYGEYGISVLGGLGEFKVGGEFDGGWGKGSTYESGWKDDEGIGLRMRKKMSMLESEIDPFRDEEEMQEAHVKKDADRTVGADTSFRWLRTRSKADGLTNPYITRTWSLANYKLVGKNDEIVAVFESNGVQSFRKTGKLKIVGRRAEKGNGLGKTGVDVVDLREVLIVLSYCVIEEKHRRES